MTKKKLSVGYVGVAFGTYFADEHHQFQRAIEGLRALAVELDFELHAIDHGVEDIDGARHVADRLRPFDLDFLIIQTAAVASGELVEPLASIAPRIGLWGTPDPHAEGPIQLHSLVAVNHYASVIRRHLKDRGAPYKWYFGHVDDPEFQRRMRVTLRALSAIKVMEQARVGWIGGFSPGFDNMAFNESSLTDRFGTTIGTHSIDDVVARARAMPDEQAERIAAEAAAMATEVTAPAIGMNRNGRIYLALKELIAEHEYDSLAVQCWPSFQDQFNVAPCMAYSLLGSEDGFPVSCEGDVPGAVSMLLLNSLSDAMGSSTLLDLTAVDPINKAALLWHCGVTPRHFAKAGQIRWVDHVTLGRKSDTRFGVSGDLVIEPQSTTIAYAGNDFSELLIATADVIDTGHSGFDGTRGWFGNFTLNGDPIELDDLVNTVIVRGQEHHYAVGQGSYASELAEVAAWLGLRTINPVPKRDYLQIEGVNIT